LIEQPYDVGALALRLMIAAEFFPTGWSTYGWHYDLTLATMNLMIALSGPGHLSLYP